MEANDREQINHPSHNTETNNKNKNGDGKSFQQLAYQLFGNAGPVVDLTSEENSKRMGMGVNSRLEVVSGSEEQNVGPVHCLICYSVSNESEDESFKQKSFDLLQKFLDNVNSPADILQRQFPKFASISIQIEEAIRQRLSCVHAVSSHLCRICGAACEQLVSKQQALLDLQRDVNELQQKILAAIKLSTEMVENTRPRHAEFDNHESDPSSLCDPIIGTSEILETLENDEVKVEEELLDPDELKVEEEDFEESDRAELEDEWSSVREQDSMSISNDFPNEELPSSPGSPDDTGSLYEAEDSSANSTCSSSTETCDEDEEDPDFKMEENDLNVDPLASSCDDDPLLTSGQSVEPENRQAEDAATISPMQRTRSNRRKLVKSPENKTWSNKGKSGELLVRIDPENRNQCPFHCGYTPTSALFLLNHIKRNHTEGLSSTKIHACKMYDSKFHSISELDGHMEGTHGGYKCSICEVKCANSHDLTRHLQVDHVSKTHVYSCDKCEKKFPRRRRLLEHIREVHEKVHEGVHEGKHQGLYQCDICGHQLTSKSGIDSHKKVTHFGIKPHVCEHCGKAFLGKTKLDIHIRRMHTGKARPFTCHVCPTVFIYRSSLLEHLKKKHPGAPPSLHTYLCEICFVKFDSTAELFKHKRKEHPLEKTHVCEHCGAGFATKGSLQQHLTLQHTEGIEKRKAVRTELIYSCDQCNAKYASISGLNYHKNTVHLGLRSQFACDQCDKKFPTKGDLNDHMRRHSGVKPFKCPSCNAPFRDSAALRLHMIRKHPDVPKDQIPKPFARIPKPSQSMSPLRCKINFTA